MEEFDEKVIEVFLKNQNRLFSEDVASTPEEAEEFLNDCMAVVCEDISEVRDYLDESGMDISGMSLDEIKECQEVFDLEDGRFLIVNG